MSFLDFNPRTYRRGGGSGVPIRLNLGHCPIQNPHVLSFEASPDKMSDNKQIMADNVRL